MLLALAVLCAAIWVGLLFFHGRFWQEGPILAPATPDQIIPTADGSAPAVTIVVPARDEAESIEVALSSLMAQDYPGPLSIILVNDRSADNTGPLARALPDPANRLHVLDGVAPQPGWSGKLWAVPQGVQEAARRATLGDGYILLTGP